LPEDTFINRRHDTSIQLIIHTYYLQQ